MIKVKFNTLDTYYSVEFRRLSEHVVKMIGNVPQNISGFKTYTLQETQLGDFSDYTTVYRVEDDGVSFSDDDSKYVEPTTTIRATFDGEKPESIDVKLSTLETITLSGDFKKVVKGDYVTILEAPQLENYNQEIASNIVVYTTKSESQIIAEKVFELKQKLADSDYEAIKYAEGWFTDEEYAPIKAYREDLREQIRALENTL